MRRTWTRSRTGEMNRFHAGIGMLIAGTKVPIVPCHIAGTFDALPATRRVPRRARIALRVAPAISFEHVPNSRDGWNEIAGTLEGKVREMALASAPARAG